MIRYNLHCDSGHAFESWFPSSASYDEQAARGLVSCPVCNSVTVAKAMMAPALSRGSRAPALIEAEAVPTAPAPPEPVAMISEPERQIRAMLRAVREHVAKTADHVGGRFPEEARRMHYGEIPARAIYGEASPDEARALVEEGIDVAPLPTLPDDRH
ncbi:DUF1178 family protein [Methylobacterium iners]|uniref:DUF1178 family protein n=1 Tax=Methylobacterium iners TaxID=418707 RepID=A0ABQ4RVI7_9HYPH|nr:DUF1178 family protein [Methylobacterium iners]GJD94734.1 hypothetical protein OCOJLMKI_1937 [Methylobacterium iners]